MTDTNQAHDPAIATPVAIDAAQGPASEFPATQPLPQELDSDWWAESVDGRCSEHAALFAASQPAPLSVV